MEEFMPVFSALAIENQIGWNRTKAILGIRFSKTAPCPIHFAGFIAKWVG